MLNWNVLAPTCTTFLDAQGLRSIPAMQRTVAALLQQGRPIRSSPCQAFLDQSLDWGHGTAWHEEGRFDARDPDLFSALALETMTGVVSAAIGVGPPNQKLFRRDEIGGAETLRKAVVDRRDAGDGLGRPALTP